MTSLDDDVELVREWAHGVLHPGGRLHTSVSRVLDRLTHLEGRGLTNDERERVEGWITEERRATSKATDQNAAWYHRDTAHLIERLLDPEPSLEGQHGEGPRRGHYADMEVCAAILLSDPRDRASDYDANPKQMGMVLQDIVDNFSPATAEAGQEGADQPAPFEVGRHTWRRDVAPVEGALPPPPSPPPRTPPRQEEALARADELLQRIEEQQSVETAHAMEEASEDEMFVATDASYRAASRYRATRNPTTKDTP